MCSVKLNLIVMIISSSSVITLKRYGVISKEKLNFLMFLMFGVALLVLFKSYLLTNQFGALFKESWLELPSTLFRKKEISDYFKINIDQWRNCAV